MPSSKIDFKLKDGKDLEGTHWIEFNISGSIESCKYWADDSKYLDEFAYSFFTDIFEKHCESFCYYGETKFQKEELIKIRWDIWNRIEELDPLETLKDIIRFSEKTSYALNLSQPLQKTYDSMNEQKDLLIRALKELGIDLSKLLTRCIDQEKVLWIIGM